MSLKFINEFGQLDQQELFEFQKDNEIQLPEDYIRFLNEYNGGKPTLNSINANYNVDWIYGFHNGPKWSNIFHAIDTYQDRIPSWYFPIANDSFGNLYIMSVYHGNHGLIAFWDHENEATENASQYFDNMVLIAKSFNDFLSKLR